MIKETKVKRNRVFLPEDAIILKATIDKFDMIAFYYEDDESMIREHNVRVLRVGEKPPAGHACIDYGKLNSGEMAFIYLEDLDGDEYD